MHKEPFCSSLYFNDHDRDKRENRFESTSLFAILLECDKSSLSSRVCLVLALANAILHLHSISWVHKVIRSHTVIFFRKPGNAELSDTYLWGFGLSRPAQQTEMTERPDSNPLYNLYRHPLAHGDAATATIGGFKKGFTSTALGPNISPPARVYKARQFEVAPGDAVPRMVRASAGDAFAEVVRACLEGALGVRIKDEESQGMILQDMFKERVVLRLVVIVV
ncbi:uncharacterized protein ATNIH1004_009390 [Aspergillus tanneri]|uniref:Protein kinase domain-containing protein n=1 Tax=Aspergillus tanneri TaxID=1220188 RepID=A0A5M9MJN3_9EURO|nr:uncharacterized protein ATNIH1004_009390 [Aspergillus tanneri]KAA8645173.1 hypothetical protein ATNIH1004_009390 [Aspergillus tanneri]